MKKTALISLILTLILAVGVSANATEAFTDADIAEYYEALEAYEAYLKEKTGKDVVIEVVPDEPEETQGPSDLTEQIAACAQFGDYGKVAEALLCAACISFDKSPEDTVQELLRRGFDFEYEITAAIPYDVYNSFGFGVTYNDAGEPEMPLMWEVSITFSPEVMLYMRTESDMVPVESAADESGISGVDVWTPAGQPRKGNIAYAHLQFFDKNMQEWIPWTFASPEKYMAK